MTAAPSDSFTIHGLLEGYRAGVFTPTEIAAQVLERAEQAPQRNVWITRLKHDQVMQRARDLERGPHDLPLYGVPFVIKDSIDLAGTPTTVACPDYAYVPERSAFVVQRLIDAGAIPLGKTNLDQFATGLVGVRSPYGACANAFDPSFVSGGSSSGSAVAVATGLAPFALATDTAGSGRVPAAFNNVVGLKPTRGLLSTRGIVPACRTADCATLMALSVSDAARVFAVLRSFDAEDPYARTVSPAKRGVPPLQRLRFGVPPREQLEFFGDAEYERCFAAAVERLAALGARPVSIDYAPFLAAGRLLYDGAWVAERNAVFAEFLASHPDSVLPVTRAIIEGGARFRATDAFRAQYELARLRRRVDALWRDIDTVVTPTAGTIYPRAAIEFDPVALNTNLGRYTMSANLLDLAALALPAGFRPDGLPFGITLLAPAGLDEALLAWGHELQVALELPLGALGVGLPRSPAPEHALHAESVALAVCGAHMEGMPLNRELLALGARLLRRTRTAPCYRLYALPDGPPHRPGLVRVPHDGAAIEVEVWQLPAAALGPFLARIPAPLGIGKLELADATWTSGFLCESHATVGATDITHLGGWRAYLASG
jgi:allophanate hydrolase